MRFLADMGISIDVVSGLRNDGHDVVHLAEERLHRLPDDEVLRKAANEQRILLAHDLDFSRLLAILQGSTPSVVSFRLRQMTPLNVLKHLRSVIHRWQVELMAGALVSVREGAARCRLLPLGNRETASGDQPG